MEFITSFTENLSALFSTDTPVLIVQIGMIVCAFVIVFLVLFATRDILTRTHSFFYQLFCILLVAVLPVVGFLLYLLIRPSTTNAQRRMRRDVEKILSRLNSIPQKRGQAPGSQEKDKGAKKNA